ncbi:MAG TPA: hypothetical protein VG297_02515 [Bryobacteraceae bacterium]|jgi:uncharacterized protein (TIGR03437 family)|nr:hypothetical protein [Bryobacteraceae bacterium]
MCFRALFIAGAGTVLAGLVYGQATRFEQNDPKITYTGTWYPNTNSLESGGSATLANLKGSQVIVLFNGTGISWIGESDGFTGICYVTLDGVPSQVDTSNSTGATLYQQKLYSVSGLPPGLHHMTIEIIHGHDGDTDQSWIWVDAFDVENGSLVAGPVPAAAGSVDQTTVSANYAGHWFQNAGATYSNGSINSAVDANARVDLTFNGTSVAWIGYRDEYSGIAQVSVDGNQQAMVDTYATPPKAQTAIWSMSGLAAGTHTLSILGTGTHDTASGGAWIWVDGFQVGGSVTAGPPSIDAGGIVSAASFMPAPNNQVSPGQIVSIFGQNLSAASANAAAIPLPAQLGPGNTSVTACGKTLPLYGVYAGQINAEIPVDCPAGAATATVSTGGTTMSQAFTVAAAAPGIFTVNASGAGDGVIAHADGTLVTATNPAVAGETVVIYATGLGPTSPAFASGAAANQTNTTVMPVSVTIGGLTAAVMYSGLTQGLVGLYQVNATVPVGLTGSQAVVVTVGGQYTSRSGVTMALE